MEQVALFIDFENLVFGLMGAHGDDYETLVEPEALMRLAEESGKVVLAQAYADFRQRSINQFQTDLYRLGIDIVPVLGKFREKSFKNAVDIKMAVDAIEILFRMPEVQTFVIVSGDRDFIHLLKTLRRYGKTVIGVSPASSTSADLAALCDRFIRYESLVKTYSQAPVLEEGDENRQSGWEDVKKAIQDLLSENPGGLKGAQIKPLLRHKLSPTFDESEYGFNRMLGLLQAMPEVVTVHQSDPGSDITVLPAKTAASAGGSGPKRGELSTKARTQLRNEAGLNFYRFEQNPRKRRKILEVIYKEMTRKQPFVLEQVFSRASDKNDQLNLSTALLSKYQAVLWQNRAFYQGTPQPDIPQHERKLSLHDSIHNLDDFIYRYEAGITYKVLQAAKSKKQEVTPRDLLEIFGLADNGANRKYVEKMMREKEGVLG